MKCVDLVDSSTSLKNIRTSISEVWSGDAGRSFLSSCDKDISAMESINKQISDFETAVEKLDQYKLKCQEIEEYEAAILYERNNPSKDSSYTYTDAAGNLRTGTTKVVDAEKIAGLYDKINKANEEKSLLKDEINTIINSIVDITTARTEIRNAISNGTFSAEFMEIYNEFMNNIYGHLPTNNTHGALSDRLSQAGIDYNAMKNLITSVKEKGLSNREQTMLIYFGFMEMCYQRNTYIHYNNANGSGEGGKPAISISRFLRGTDCVGAIDFMVNAGCADENGNNVVEWRPCITWGNNTEHYYSPEDYSKIKPGDLYCSSGHIAMVVGVDLNRGVYYTLEDGNFRGTRRLRDLNAEHFIANADNIYNGYANNNPGISDENRRTENYIRGKQWMV